eukprot:403334016
MTGEQKTQVKTSKRKKKKKDDNITSERLRFYKLRKTRFGHENLGIRDINREFDQQQYQIIKNVSSGVRVADEWYLDNYLRLNWKVDDTINIEDSRNLANEILNGL